MKVKSIKSYTTLLEGKDRITTLQKYEQRLNDYINDNQELKDFIQQKFPEYSNEKAVVLFTALMASDPTYQEGSKTTGKYGEWLLNNLLNGNISVAITNIIQFAMDVDIYDAQQAPITPYEFLKTFEDKKRFLRNKDLNSYKDLKELFNLMILAQPSDRQKERAMRNAFKEAELVYSDNQWQVWIPTTYEASCSLGKGTNWCTADSRNRSFYDEYTGDGLPLYIFISREDPSEKFQWGTRTGLFTDADFLDKDDKAFVFDLIFGDDEALCDWILENNIYVEDFYESDERVEALAQYLDKSCWWAYKYLVENEDEIQFINKWSTTDELFEKVCEYLPEFKILELIDSDALWKALITYYENQGVTDLNQYLEDRFQIVNAREKLLGGEKFSFETLRQKQNLINKLLNHYRYDGSELKEIFISLDIDYMDLIDPKDALDQLYYEGVAFLADNDVCILFYA